MVYPNFAIGAQCQVWFGQFLDGLANSSGYAGQNLMFNGAPAAIGLFDEPANAYRSVPTSRVMHDFYSLDSSLGFYGGCCIDARHPSKGLPMGAGLGGSMPITEEDANVHLLGTCRMGNDANSSVVDRYNRSHDVPNLFMVDGSSLVTGDRGQPTMAIMALAFRAAGYIISAAKRNRI